MANYNEESSVKLDFAMPFQRTGKFPLDRSSMFSSYDDAVKYAKGDTSDPDSRGLCGSSYIGQQICVYENDEVKLYVIDQNRTLKSIENDAFIVLFSGTTVIDANHTVSEINQAFYKNKRVIALYYISREQQYYLLTLQKATLNRVIFYQNNISYDSSSTLYYFCIVGTKTDNGSDYWTCKIGSIDFDGYALRNLGIYKAVPNQIVSIATVDDGAPKSYSTLDIASDDDVNAMITEVLGSYSTQQQPSSIILNSNTADSTKQFELTIDDTGTLTSQEL